MGSKSASSQHLGMSQNSRFSGNPQNFQGFETSLLLRPYDNTIFAGFVPPFAIALEHSCQENRSSSKGIQSAEFSRCTDLSFDCNGT